MFKLPDGVRSSLLQALEVAVCMMLALGALKLLGMESEAKTLIGGIILSGIAKFARDSDLIPVSDYVNGTPFKKLKKGKL